MKSIKLSLFIVISIALFDCKPEIRESKPLGYSSTIFQGDGSCIAANGVVYDSAGVGHNQALEFVRQNVGFNGTTIEQRYNAINIWSNNRYQQPVSSLVSLSELQTYLADSTNNYASVINNLNNLSPYAKQKAISILSGIRNFAGQDYCGFKSFLNTLEAEINNDTQLTEQEKTRFLRVLSIGRFSGKYWIDTYGANSNEKKWGFWKIFGVVAADVFGGFLGGPSLIGIVSVEGALSASVANLDF